MAMAWWCVDVCVLVVVCADEMERRRAGGEIRGLSMTFLGGISWGPVCVVLCGVCVCVSGVM
jgi:hypothetical protein